MPTPAGLSEPELAASIHIAAPVFEHERSRASFMLAQRLASVARLNVLAGRKPFVAPIRRDTPAIPVDRLGAKKLRPRPNGLRVLVRTNHPRPSADIIPFPGRSAAKPALLRDAA